MTTDLKKDTGFILKTMSSPIMDNETRDYLTKNRKQLENKFIEHEGKFYKVIFSGHGVPGLMKVDKTPPLKRENKKIGRNEKCPCNSGKKFKRCHGNKN